MSINIVKCVACGFIFIVYNGRVHPSERKLRSSVLCISSQPDLSPGGPVDIKPSSIPPPKAAVPPSLCPLALLYVPLEPVSPADMNTGGGTEDAEGR